MVKPLDTIDSIAKKLNVQKQELIHKNNITRLFIGQKLEY
ncbi:MAG: LysM peptidoglycan-binding domain-containing protein [Clostridia bacterium]|nr:LysM peptidoglycan-binding domain-containing protein [Clostridia bacterium]